MQDEQSTRNIFINDPPPVSSLIWTVLEPGIAVLLLYVLHLAYGWPFGGVARAVVVFLLLTYPWLTRLRHGPTHTATEIVLHWLTVCLLLLLLLGYVTDGWEAFPPDLLITWGIAVPLTQWTLAKGVGAWMRHRAQTSPTRRPAVIVGANRMSLRVAEVLAKRAWEGRQLLGVFDDRSGDRVPESAHGYLLGKMDELPQFIDAHGVKDVFITLPLTSQPRIAGLMEALQNTTASLHFVPDIFGLSIIQGRLTDMGGVPVVGLLSSPFTGVNGLIKRASDLVLASLILLLISPVMLLVAVGVRLSSPGPVIFRQRRTGLDGEIIEVYKFRSMTVQENDDAVVQAKRGDARVTPFGAFIRRTSLDELPQFFNVLQGRMSIVGPRPHAVAHNQMYRSMVKAYMARHKVKPGITGWAQVNGLRGETDTLDKMARRVEYDLEYLRNWSLGLDLLIIFKTAKLMFFDRSAY
ncbi:undecaprenyl-phosphate glucose phosphotransferase [Ideonella oryzae]|uniref:Undecaprenyl-phosphate glucose phosphotransferase n=1 Tax=Ideonella oryzae TaxID=2937441 RepID=A0ABT1BRT7_9BURK|nr:undecaprenyl-phosphate glucose phosphotransferase [Ideonella oryzae]MCO5978893.1 undecaprenyl-phosphate glucose phosphotransferase [Ideonella oryzae]